MPSVAVVATAAAAAAGWVLVMAALSSTILTVAVMAKKHSRHEGVRITFDMSSPVGGVNCFCVLSLSPRVVAHQRSEPSPEL